MKRTSFVRHTTLALLAMLLCLYACPPAAQAQDGEDPPFHGTLATLYEGGAWGPTIYDADLRKVVDEYITEYHSTLMIFTQCYGGDMVDDFVDRPNTTVLSATMPGQKSYYGGYTDGASAELRPGPGRTSDDVHNGGIGTKKHDEQPNSHGPAVSLEDTSEEGPIKSRHVIFYAGEPDKKSGRDYDTRQQLYDNFSGKLNTIVLSVGGSPDSQGKGTDGWDYPGNLDGLKGALREIGQSMGPDEQFIMFVGDHGDRQKMYSDFELDSGVTGEFTVNFSLEMLEDMIIEGETGDTGVTFQLVPGVELSEELQPGDLKVQLKDSGAAVDKPEAVWIGYGDSPTEFDSLRLFFPFTKEEMVPYSPGEWPLDDQNHLPFEFTLENTLEQSLQFDWVSTGTGTVPKQDGGSSVDDGGTAGPGPSNPSSSQPGSPGDQNIPVLQLELSPTLAPTTIYGISVMVTGTANLNLLESYNIVLDANLNGVEDSGDELLSSEIPLLKDVPVLSSFITSREVDTDSELLILVTANLVESSDSSSISENYGHRYVLAAWPLLLLFVPVLAARWRRRNWVALVSLGVLLAIVVSLAACGRGTDNTPPDNQGTFSFTVTDVDAKETASGDPVNFSGLPLTGSTLTVSN